MSDLSLAIHFFLQMAAILLGVRAIGAVARRLGQPQVVGEMIAGVVLGPSLLGLVAPDVLGFLFPRMLELAGGLQVRHPSMQVLFVVSQLGLVLYMFVVGLELDLGLLRQRAGGAVAVSLAGILVPFVLGAGLSSWAVPRFELVAPTVSAWEAAFFFGAAMCITAFPMLARLLYERGVARTAPGTLSLAAGAIDDAVAWLLLAGVLAAVQSTPAIALKAFGGAALFVVFAATAGRRIGARLAAAGPADGPRLGWLLTYVIGCAWFTDAAGVYSVFGAFVAGATLPRGAFADSVKEKVESVASAVLLPVFFVYSGLNTQLTLVASAEALLLSVLVVGAAVLGKGGACAVAARRAGLSWRESFGVGALMNARGLMELILLNIGLQHGVITPLAFTVFVLMAIVTTLMATPLFNRIAAGTAFEGVRPGAA